MIDLGRGWEWVDQSSPEFEKALELILHSDHNLFVCGSAGTGKSVLVRLAYEKLMGRTLVMASTGVASANLIEDGVPTSTIHSALRIPPLGMFDSSTRIDPEKMELLAHTDTLIIDEISMVSCALFDHIERMINRATKKGAIHHVRVIVFGDVLQLPPVVKMNDEKVGEYYSRKYMNRTFFFNSGFFSMHGNFRVVQLNKVYRQKEDSFQNVLNRIRLNVHDEADLRRFDGQVIGLEEYIRRNPLSLILASTNNAVLHINELFGVPKGSPFLDYNASMTGNFKLDEYGDVVHVHERIYVGQQVMCNHNDKEEGYVNGTLGIVESVTPNCVRIRCNGGERRNVVMETWRQMEMVYNEETCNIEPKETGTLAMIGCKPAKAVTIHKAQGLTLDNVYLYMEGSHWMPDSGVYLALSRCKTLGGIGLSRKLTDDMIHINGDALDFLIKEDERERRIEQGLAPEDIFGSYEDDLLKG